MSVVTNLLIAYGNEDDEKVLQQLSQYLHHEQPFRIVSVEDATLPKGWYGGSKHLETGLLIGAYNSLQLAELLAFMKTMEWAEPEDVQLIVKEQWDIKFRIIDLFPGAWA